MEEDFVDLPKQEVNDIQNWEEQLPEDPQEAVIHAEVNYVYQRYGRPPPFGQFCGPRPQDNGYTGGKPQGGLCPNTPHSFAPRHSNTTMANQEYTFNGLNGTTTHPNIMYVPGNLSMAPITLPPPYQILYRHNPQTQQFNMFAKQGDANNAPPVDNTNASLDQISKLLVSRNMMNHQLQEIQTNTPVAGNTWDIATTLESSQEDDPQE